VSWSSIIPNNDGRRGEIQSRGGDDEDDDEDDEDDGLHSSPNNTLLFPFHPLDTVPAELPYDPHSSDDDAELPPTTSTAAFFRLGIGMDDDIFEEGELLIGRGGRRAWLDESWDACG
jgi:hypothetical protein